jgi:hypothetical protein
MTIKLSYEIHYMKKSPREIEGVLYSCEPAIINYSTIVNLNKRTLATGYNRAIKHANSIGIDTLTIFDVRLVCHD